MGQWDLSDDEWGFLLVAGFVAVTGAKAWYAPLVRARPLAPWSGPRWLLGLTPVVGLGGLLCVLQTWADPELVVGHLDYVLLFSLGGLAWMWTAGRLSSWLGAGAREDALEQRNGAAALASCGALLGAITIYAWCNVGAGPTILTTIAPAIIATAVWLALWLLLDFICGLAERIALERDVAAGLRQAAWLIATGSILGRAMAGDWTSWSSTFREFAELAWPVVFVLAAAILMNRIFRLTPARSTRSVLFAGVVPGLALLALAAVYIAWLPTP